jgi:hypothetical protein
MGGLSNIAQYFLYVGHFRRFVYDILVLTKYKITTLVVVLNIYTNVLYKMQSSLLSTHFSYLCGKQSIAALYSSLLRQCKGQ